MRQECVKRLCQLSHCVYFPYLNLREFSNQRRKQTNVPALISAHLDPIEKKAFPWIFTAM